MKNNFEEKLIQSWRRNSSVSKCFKTEKVLFSDFQNALFKEKKCPKVHPNCYLFHIIHFNVTVFYPTIL